MTRNLLGARLVDVGEGDLSQLTDIDAAGEVAPARAGLSPRAVNAIWDGVESLYRTGAYPAITFCLRRRGRIVLNRSLGYAYGGGPDDRPGRGRDARLAEPDTPVCLFSASKAITAILIHKLAEEGAIDLDAPVSRYLREFAGGGKDRTTIAQVLAHRGGFPMFNVHNARPEMLTDWDECIRLICAAPAEGGRKRLAYHAITGGFILAEVIRRITGQPFTDYLDSRLRQPLGMRYFTFGLAQNERPRVAYNYAAGQPVRFPISVIARQALTVGFDEVIDVSNRDFFMDAVVPAGNLYATAEEVSRFYQMLLDNGRYNGRQILEPATIRRALKPACRLRYDHTLKIPMRYSEGMMLGVNPFGLYGPMTGDAFGHLGFMNILGWADPARELSAGLLVTGKAILGGHLFALGQLLSTLAWRCRSS